MSKNVSFYGILCPYNNRTDRLPKRIKAILPPMIDDDIWEMMHLLSDGDYYQILDSMLYIGNMEY